MRRFAQAATADDLVAMILDRASLLDSHESYLYQRWKQGCHDVTGLQNRGYRGSIRTLYRFLQPVRALDPGQTILPAKAASPGPPKIRHVTSWLPDSRC